MNAFVKLSASALVLSLALAAPPARAADNAPAAAPPPHRGGASRHAGQRSRLYLQDPAAQSRGGRRGVVKARASADPRRPPSRRTDEDRRISCLFEHSGERRAKEPRLHTERSPHHRRVEPRASRRRRWRYSPRPRLQCRRRDRRAGLSGRRRRVDEDRAAAAAPGRRRSLPAAAAPGAQANAVAAAPSAQPRRSKVVTGRSHFCDRLGRPFEQPSTGCVA